MSDNLPPSAVKFHYIKGNFFRVIHADGAIGGLTPARNIYVALFSERAAMPQVVELTVRQDGSLGDEVKRVGKEGLVREIEVGVMLNATTAQRLAEWLLKQAQILKESEPESAPGSTADLLELP